MSSSGTRAADAGGDCGRRIQRELLASGARRWPWRLAGIAAVRLARRLLARRDPGAGPALDELVPAIWLPPLEPGEVAALPADDAPGLAWHAALMPEVHAGTDAARRLPWDGSLRAFHAPAREPRAEWEVHRLQWLVPMARAGVERPALRALATRMLDEWHVWARQDGRPFRESPMEGAIRLLSLLASAPLLREEPAFRDHWWPSHGRALVAHHLHWVRHHLEDDQLRPSNHALVNVAALVCAHACMTNGARRARAWGRVLARYAAAQHLADGGQYERSTAYHRFVLEALLLAVHALRARGLPSRRLEAVVRGALAFQRALGSPEPLLGDHDSGRILRPGAAGRHEAWWEALAATIAGEAAPPRAVELLPRFGLAVLRAGAARAVLSGGVGGQDGRGGHAHNDQLSVTLAVGGQRVVVDPGTSGYLGDPARRVDERSAASHSTLLVDEAEPYPVCRSSPFALPQDGRGGVERDGATGVAATHAWGSAGRALRARRAVTLSARALDIRDEVEGAERQVEARWLLAGAWREVAREPGRVRVAHADGRELTIDAPWGRLEVESASWAPSFGVLAPATRVRCVAPAEAARGQLATRLAW